MVLWLSLLSSVVSHLVKVICLRFFSNIFLLSAVLSPSLFSSLFGMPCLCSGLVSKNSCAIGETVWGLGWCNLVGDPYKPSFAAITGRGPHPSYTRSSTEAYIYIGCSTDRKPQVRTHFSAESSSMQHVTDINWPFSQGKWAVQQPHARRSLRRCHAPSVDVSQQRRRLKDFPKSDFPLAT